MLKFKHPPLEYETNVYKTLASGVSVCLLSGGLVQNVTIADLDVLGLSLQDLFIFCHHNFGLKTKLLLTD